MLNLMYTCLKYKKKLGGLFRFGLLLGFVGSIASFWVYFVLERNVGAEGIICFSFDSEDPLFLPSVH